MADEFKLADRLPALTKAATVAGVPSISRDILLAS